jgi:crotonobetainyl-CoA:carnitine CoA-transferase CaiB-like acyl-CoA transferase/dihydrofolate reductase
MSGEGSMTGLRVIDLTTDLCGPFCTMHLGDAGAEVIKVEPPDGDPVRRVGPMLRGESAVFLSLNRNKKSVVIDYHSAQGRELVRRLARDADVLVEDLGPGRAAQAGLGYDALSPENPRLVYCAISAFGEEGPLKDLPGAELTIQAMAEYTASLGSIGAPPIRVGADIASLNTSIFAVQAILAALFHRERGGKGQRVAVSQLGSLLHLRGIMWHALSNPDDWYGFHLDSYTYPPEHGYQTKDGPMYFILRHGSSEDWDRFVIELGMEAYLNDPRFGNYGRRATGIGQHAAEVRPIWEAAFKDRNREEIIDLVRSIGGDAVPILDYPALVSHPQVQALGALTEIDHPTAGPFATLAPVVRFSETPSGDPQRAPHHRSAHGRSLARDRPQRLRNQRAARVPNHRIEKPRFDPAGRDHKELNMRKLLVFNNLTLDGYFTGVNGDFSWAHAGSDDPEFGAFVAENASGEGQLLFGRITYELMASYWPTADAAKNAPVMAEGMNRRPKAVFSRTLDKVSWSNTRVLKSDIVSAIRRMKQEPGPDMAILGSGSIVAQLAPEGLIDQYQVVVNPVVLGNGRTMFDGIRKALALKLTSSRTFSNGKVFLCYEPKV